ncbi:MAG: hypothetical protein IJW62_07640 [Clostridia bacterium]|nr:hypothetical protein [Clostridia bacterium]
MESTEETVGAFCLHTTSPVGERIALPHSKTATNGSHQGNGRCASFDAACGGAERGASLFRRSAPYKTVLYKVGAIRTLSAPRRRSAVYS